MIDPILLIGGAGVVGRWTAHYLRTAHPKVPILVGGRNLAKAEQAAAEITNATGVVINLTADDLGLGDVQVSAVAVLFMDERIASLRFAQARSVPHISISPGINEMAPEVAAYIHSPRAAPVILGTEWLVGATSMMTLGFAKAFDHVDTITIGALLDEQDAFGPAALADLERQTKTLPAALVRRDGVFTWLAGDDVKTSFAAADGTRMEAMAFSPYDVVGLATVLGAQNVQFKLALGESSTRRRGESMSTEILIELRGSDHAGRSLSTRHAVVHPEGQMPLTGLGVAMLLERVTGLDGSAALQAGLYFPLQLLDPATYVSRLKQAGGEVLVLAVA